MNGITKDLLLALGFVEYGSAPRLGEQSLAYHGQHGVLTVRLKNGSPIYWGEDGKSMPESLWPVNEERLRSVCWIMGKVKT